MLELNPILEKESNNPLYCQLYRYIREEIKSNHIPMGTRLPSIRQLSENLKLSKNTIEGAYQQLIDEGYVESRPRSGLYVAELEKGFDSSKTVDKNFKNEVISIIDKINYKYDFDSNAVDLESFPFTVWRRLINESMNIDKDFLFKYDDTNGEIVLRQELARYLRHSRGVYCKAEQIIIGSTSQHLVSILCQLIGLKDFKIAMEDPGCIEMKSIFRNLGFEVVSIPIEKDGINVNILRNSGAKVVYVSPSKQFPSGVVMPIGKRLSLLKWAEEGDGIIIEGDYDGEYRYIGKPIPALQGLKDTDRVVYLSTFSKYLLPSICISYMVLPEKLLELYNRDYNFYEQSVPRVNQQILYNFIQKGHWESHIRKMRTVYSKKHASLINSISLYLDNRVSIVGKDAGLHVLVEIDNGMNEEQLVEAAAALNVKVYPYSTYLSNSKGYFKPRIILGFGGLKIKDIEDGVKLLNKAWL